MIAIFIGEPGIHETKRQMIKMWDTLKAYVLTANDRKNFTVKQLQILFHHFKPQMQPLSADFDRLTIMTGLQRNRL